MSDGSECRLPLAAVGRRQCLASDQAPVMVVPAHARASDVWIDVWIESFALVVDVASHVVTDLLERNCWHLPLHETFVSFGAGGSQSPRYVVLPD